MTYCNYIKVKYLGLMLKNGCKLIQYKNEWRLLLRLRNVPGAREVMVENEYVFTEPEGNVRNLERGIWK